MNPSLLVGLFLTFTAPGAVNGAVNGRCSVNSTSGVCLSTSQCTARGGTYQTGYCLGDPPDVKCCTKASCSTGGSCKWTDQCTNGLNVSGSCPGPAPFQCCLPLGTSQSTGCVGQLLLRAFIPSEVVFAGLPAVFSAFIAFNGNNRDFCHDCGDSKADLAAFFKYDLAGRFDLSKTAPGDGGFGPTKEFKLEDTYQNALDPYWVGRLKESTAKPTRQGRVNRTATNLAVTAKQITGSSGVLKFVVNAGDPLLTIPLTDISVAPPLNVQLDVGIVSDASGFEFTVNGTHDAWPSFEIYIGQRQIYRYDCIASKTGPFNLVNLGGLLNTVYVYTSAYLPIAELVANSCMKSKP